MRILGVRMRYCALAPVRGNRKVRIRHRLPPPRTRGIGLAVGDVAKSLLTLAGVHDSWGFATGNTKTKVNYCMATFDALRQTAKIRVTDEQAERLNIATGPVGLAGADESADIDEQREE